MSGLFDTLLWAVVVFFGASAFSGLYDDLKDSLKDEMKKEWQRGEWK